MLTVPVEQLVTTGGGGTAADLRTIMDCYAAFDEGNDGMDTEYARSLPNTPTETPAQRIHRLFIAHFKGLDDAPPMKVHIAASGRMELLDGYHRAAAHVYQGRKMAAVEVVSVSPLWQELVDRLRNCYPGNDRMLYQAIEHPYFQNWTVNRSSDRIRMMLEYWREHQPKSNTMLDIGSCTGAVCRAFARAGVSTYGIDHDPNAVWIAEYLSLVLGGRTTYQCTDSLSLLDSGYRWGSVVCLSVFYRDIVNGRLEEAASKYKHMMQRSQLFFVDNIEPHYAARFPQRGIEIGDSGIYREWLQGLSDEHVVDVLGMTEGRTLYACRRIR